MERVGRSRRTLAGLLRRRPILDSAVTVPGGPGPHPVDEEFQAILEMGTASLPEDGEAGNPTG